MNQKEFIHTRLNSYSSTSQEPLDKSDKSLRSYSNLTNRLYKDRITYGESDRDSIEYYAHENCKDINKCNEYMKFLDKYLEYPIVSIDVDREYGLFNKLSKLNAIDSLILRDTDLNNGIDYDKLEYLGDGIIRESYGSESDNDLRVVYYISKDSTLIYEN